MMNLEHVFADNPTEQRERYRTVKNKSTPHYPSRPNFDHDLFNFNSQIERILHQISEQGLLGLKYVRAYLHDQHRRNCRPNTIRSTGAILAGFLRFLKGSGLAQIQAFTREHIAAFVEREQERGLSPNSVSTQLRCVYAFVNFLIERDVLDPDLLKRKLRIKVPDALPRAIDPEHIKQLLAVIKKPRDLALVLTLLRTGMRIGELLNTTVEDINLQDRFIQITEAQKNRTGRVVYLSNDACNALKKWLNTRGRQSQVLFYGYRGCVLSYEAARMMFQKYLEKAGLTHKGYTLHCLRHTCASELLNAGMPLQCLQELLGHSCIEMTRRYARLTDNTRREQYYKAMAVIETGELNGHYQLDYQLP
jgi:integrase/recombinase XerD